MSLWVNQHTGEVCLNFGGRMLCDGSNTYYFPEVYKNAWDFWCELDQSTVAILAYRWTLVAMEKTPKQQQAISELQSLKAELAQP